MSRWAFRSDDYLRALGADPTYTGMDLAEGALPVVVLEAEHVAAPLYSYGLTRMRVPPSVAQFSIMEIIAPPTFGIWIQNLLVESSVSLLVGFTQLESSTPIAAPTVKDLVWVNPEGIRANFTGAATGLVVRFGTGSAGVAPVDVEQAFLMPPTGEFTAWQPLWLPAGAHFYLFSQVVNVDMSASFLIRGPAALLH